VNPLEQFSPVPFFVFQLNNTFFNLTSVSVMFFFIFFVLSIFITGPMFKTNNLFFFKSKNIQSFNKNILNLNNKLKLNLGLTIENNTVLENNLDSFSKNSFQNQLLKGTLNSFVSFFPTTSRFFFELLYSTVIDTVKDNIGGSKNETIKFFPVVFTIFLFILLSNLLGLIPYSSTITGYLIITFALAMIVLVGIWFQAFRVKGISFFGSFIPSGCPTWLWPLIIPIELISNVFRLISLPVRLFANMMAGHLLLGVLAGFGFVILMFQTSFFGNVFIFPTIVIYVLVFLEVAVAFIQAIVFTILTCVYLDEALNMH